MAEPNRAGFFAALKRLLATLLASGRARLELLSVELEEEKIRVLDLLVSALAAVFFIALAIVLGIAFLAVAYWEQRVLVFGGACVATLLIGVLLLLRIRGLTAKPSRLFRSSLAELDKDLDALRAQSAEHS
ncbi:MAG TPA: phage holin family protein [Rhodocyclaceae bacterium]|nr:phage holin family protein [Rhodocyclaceae bacterium]